jgi:hypothetical protein
VLYADSAGIAYVRRAAGAASFASIAGFGADVSGALAFDAAGGMHVVVGDATGQAWYFYRAHGATEFATAIPFGEQPAVEPSIAVDRWNAVHVGYAAGYAGSTEYLHYAYKPPGGSFTSGVVSEFGEDDGLASVSVDATGGVHLTYASYHVDLGVEYFQDAYLDRTCH